MERLTRPLVSYRSRRSSGFTLVELLIVLAVLGVLSSIALPLAKVTIRRTQEQELHRALHDVRHAIDAYKRASDEGRIPRIAGRSGYPPDLETLVEGVADQRSPTRSKLFFLRRVPRDPMAPADGGPESASWGKRSSASEADNPQEGEDIYDVYTKSNETGLNGVPYQKW